LSSAWNATQATARYQIQCSAKPAARDIRIAGTTIKAVRMAELMSGGSVSPIAWNMLELTNTIPEGMKFQATMRKYSAPTATTPGSLLKIPTSAPGTRRQITSRTSIAAVAIPTPTRNVPRTRSGRRAPKF